MEDVITDPQVEADDGAKAAKAEFDQHVTPRRKTAGVPGDPKGSWGIALSGGGVRSATLCLGVIRGLARNGLLRHFDYLSTVSGGGYIGASVGRLFRAGVSAKDVEAGIAKDNSMWLWWLRNNGRYLTPAGAKDLGFATASILRGIVSTHLEIGILVLMLAALVLAPHLLVSLLPPLEDGSLRALPFVSLVGSVWWWSLPLPVFAVMHQLFGYWYTRDSQSWTSSLLILAAAAGGVALSLTLQGAADARFQMHLGNTTVPAASIVALYLVSFLSLAPVTAWVATGVDLLRRKPVVGIRLKRTKRLAYSLWALAGMFALGVLDLVTWRLTALFWDPENISAPYRLTALVAVVLAAGRLALPEIQRRLASSKQPNINIEKILNLLGILLALLVAVFWTTLLSIALFPIWNSTRLLPANASWLDAPQVVTWGIVVGLCLLYVAATRRSFDLLNLASLHNFYRARIERAYVSSGNCDGPEARFPSSSLNDVSSENTWRVAPLTEAIEGDDVELTDYTPHRHGGPIHLINCCINQSVDDRTGNYNADRKGVSLTVGSLGAESGTGFAPSPGFVNPPGRLSRWIAISGAAASTGMGSRTSPGFASLLFLSGLRLGFWTKSLLASSQRPERLPKRFRSTLLDFAPKPLAIVAESMARFPGLFSSIWYVSDGGHFDNTGIYSLLKRRPKVIVAADCGADPKYLFSDLESLVRKAKIDFGATIEFVDPAKLGEKLPAELSAALGTPENISPEAASNWLVLGRIQYRDKSEGALLIVKPRRLDKMPFDIVAYADRNPDFPQQSTGDQFFDEAQWEAYHQLGVLLGDKLTPILIEQARAAVSDMIHAPSSLLKAEEQTRAQEPKVGRRDRAGLTARATLGAGISLSVLLATWQGVEQYRESRRAENKDYDTLFVAHSREIREDNLDTLLAAQFSSFAEQSERRGDGRFDYLRNSLNSRCELLAEGNDKQACESLYTDLTSEPKPFYDYWFADKLPRYAVESGEEAEIAAAAIGDAAITDAASTDAIVAIPPPPPPPSPQPETEASVIREVEATQVPALPATAKATRPVQSRGPASAVLSASRARTACTGSGARIFLHIYDESSRAAAEQIAARLDKELGFGKTPIQNVVETAKRNRRQPPYVWSSPAVVAHPGAESNCVDAVRSIVSSDTTLRNLPPSVKGSPGVLEIWLPPRTGLD